MSSNAGRAWAALFRFIQSQKPWMNDRAAEHDLTPQSAHALFVLGEQQRLTMREFADELHCDASNATGVVDRLQRRGFVERSESPTDRRVKLLQLTAAGRRMYKRLDERFLTEAPPPLEALSAADQRTLREILERALEHHRRVSVDGIGERAG